MPRVNGILPGIARHTRRLEDRVILNGCKTTVFMDWVAWAKNNTVIPGCAVATK
jgi:hypothetical protein